MASDNLRANIYALANPATVKAEENFIKRIFYQSLGILDSAEHEFYVSASSGWISYVNLHQIRQKHGSLRLPSAEEARTQAENFLRNVMRGFANRRNSQLPEALKSLVLIPPLKPVKIVQVPRPDESVWDHWLYQAQPQLVLNQNNTIDVFGSQVDVRIGEAGKVISFHSRWRPLTAEKFHSTIYQFSEEDSPEHQRGDSHQEQHQLVYLLEGDGIPQYYLSPYYLIDEGHDISLTSASSYSLIVAFNVKANEEDNTIITAIVIGGSGHYAFNWARYSLDDILEGGLIEIGEGSYGELLADEEIRIETSSITVPLGAHVILVNVKDRATGAFKHHQQQVYTFPSLKQEPPDSPRVVTA